MAKRKLVVIEESTLAAMAVNAAFTAEFPFLKGLSSAQPKAGCRPCQARAAAARQSSNMSQAKAAIAGMDSTKRRKMKDLLNAEQVRVTYRNTSGKTIQLTF